MKEENSNERIKRILAKLRIEEVPDLAASDEFAGEFGESPIKAPSEESEEERIKRKRKEAAIKMQQEKENAVI